jgi:hypothetical protein
MASWMDDVDRIITQERLSYTGRPYRRMGTYPLLNAWDSRDNNEVLNQLLYCLDCISSTIEITKPNSNTKQTSYNLKHTVERWAQTHGQNQYISNGVAILAIRMLNIGKQNKYVGPNAILNYRERVFMKREARLSQDRLLARDKKTLVYLLRGQTELCDPLLKIIGEYIGDNSKPRGFRIPWNRETKPATTNF